MSLAMQLLSFPIRTLSLAETSEAKSVQRLSLVDLSFISLMAKALSK